MPTERNTTIEPYMNVPYAELPTTTEEQEGMYRGVKELQIGFGSRVLRADSQGLWLGAERFEDAPFSVDMDGNITAVSLDLSNFLEVGEAAGDINSHSTTISGGKITTGSITASKLNVSELEAITAVMGDLTAGTLTGSTLTTANSGQRVVLTSTLALYYNSSNQDIVSTYASSNSYLLKGERSSSSLYFDCGLTGTIAFLSDGDLSSIYDPNNGRFAPYLNGGMDLGASGAAWADIFAIGTFRYQAVDQPVHFFGYVDSAGFEGSPFPITFSASRGSTGVYTVSFNESFGSSNYTVVVTPLRSSAVRMAKVSARNSSSFTVRINDETGTLQDSDFMFHICLEP